jgi:hypothetical protein
MAMSEFRHFSATGNFPSSARLPRLTTRLHVFEAAYPRVRLQAAGVVQPWLDPTYAYRVSLADLASAGVNPLLETMPRAPPKARPKAPPKAQPAAAALVAPGRALLALPPTSPIAQPAAAQQLQLRSGQ